MLWHDLVIFRKGEIGGQPKGPTPPLITVRTMGRILARKCKDAKCYPAKCVATVCERDEKTVRFCLSVDLQPGDPRDCMAFVLAQRWSFGSIARRPQTVSA